MWGFPVGLVRHRAFSFLAEGYPILSDRPGATRPLAEQVGFEPTRRDKLPYVLSRDAS